MKNVKILLLAILAMTAGLVTACGPKENFEPGPVTGGAHVYFPNDAQTVFSLGDDDKSITIPVYREVKEGALEVSLLADFGDMEDADQALFTGIPSAVSFADGQDKAEIVVSFDRKKLVDGKEYAISFLLSDEDNTFPYGDKIITVSITPWPWISMGKGVYIDGFLCGMFNNGNIAPVEVNVYKHKTREGIYMFDDLFGWNFLTTFFEAPQEAIEAQVCTYNPTGIEVDCSDPEKVVIPQQLTGIIDNDPNYGAYTIASLKDMFGKLKDGIITFPVKGLGLFIQNGNGLETNPNGTFTLVLPGYEISDYSLSAQYAGMRVDPDNTTVKAVFDLTYGADVTGISYVCVEGDRTDEVQQIAEGMANGTVKPVYEVEGFVPGAGAVSIETVLTKGAYTLVAVPKAKDGSLSVDNAFAADFYFPGMEGGDIPEVDATVTLYNVSKLPGITPDLIQKYPDETNLAYVITGSEIKSLRYYANQADVIGSIESQGLTLEQVVTEYGKDMTKAEVEDLNKTGKAEAFFINLREGTAYQLAIIAENIYGKRKLILSDPVSTAMVEYNGELVVGDYSMSCKPDNVSGLDEPFVNKFRLLPTADSDTKFKVVDFGIEDNTEWNAVYDPAKQTLTLDGIQVGYEDKGNYFGKPYGYWDANQTQVYGVYAFNNPDDPKDGTGPVVFKVDPATKRLSSLETEVMVPVFDAKTGEMLGVGGSYLAGSKTTVAYLSAKVSAVPASVRTYGRISPNLACVTASAVISRSDSGIRTVEMDAKVCEPLEKAARFSAKRADLVLSL